jgi:multisubunit Na+/H+ antiporter MnhF subunit
MFTVDNLLNAAMVICGIAIILCAVRLWRGPHIADRAVALDQITIDVVAIVILYSMKVKSLAFLDAALVVALIGFLSTLAFARYIGRGSQ